MGHNVHPKAHRLTILYPWDSRWYGRHGKPYTALLKEEVSVRKYLTKKLREAGLDSISIARNANEVTVSALVAKPGVIIGRGGAGIEDLKKELQTKYFAKGSKVKVQIFEVKQPSLSSAIVAEQIVDDTKKRMAFRRVMKSAIERVMKAGAEGVKCTMSGRLNGAEIARSETLAQGKIPLQTLRADIDYANTEAHTMYGKIGIKVWINRGLVFGGKQDKFAPEKNA